MKKTLPYNFYQNLQLEFVCTCTEMKIVEDFEEHGSRQGNSKKIWQYLKNNFSDLFVCINDVSLVDFVDYYNPFAKNTRIRSDKKFLYVTDSGTEYMFKILNKI